MDHNIQKIKIISSGDSNIFSTDKYVIPLYQRAFAWEYTEILQMVDDIENFETDNYYLGTLIVFKRNDNKFEVIDGQQRLTALYLLLTVLGIDFESNAVSFEYRQKSDDSLSKLKNAEGGDWRKNADEGILSGFDVISKRLDGKGKRRPRLNKRLKRVNMVRVVVPPNTDLNKYFEIMNNRGEQLEQQDIVKSRLMGMIRTEEEREAFAHIWDACSDMSGYVQMHFDKSERDHYFSCNWDVCPDDLSEYYLYPEKAERAHGNSIDYIASNADITSKNIETIDNSAEDNMRFESFITFRHFLLHVLTIYKMGKYDNQKWGGELIDDKKLIQRFEEAFPHKRGMSDRVLEFGICLLRCRFLFDNHMLKREFVSDDIEGRWSLKGLRVSWSNNKKNQRRQPKAYYADISDSAEIKMLQSMLRVTYTSPLVMHWATEFLAWLYFNFYKYDTSEAIEKLESIAEVPVKEFLAMKNHSSGLDTPHIVLNYLDYLLWKEEKTEFQFEFRNSVEHWYPQNPIDSNVRWPKSALDHFGNLCLVSSGLNSKFSNNLPLAKKTNFGSGIKRQSLKLQVMATLTNDTDAWTEDTAVSHGKKMLAKLEKAVSG